MNLIIVRDIYDILIKNIKYLSLYEIRKKLNNTKQITATTTKKHENKHAFG